MQVGTEDEPYDTKLYITLTGTKSDPVIPIYGNKVIGVRNGTLDIHGSNREPYWTQLGESALFESTSITLKRKVDWKVGEEIGIAPTSYGP